MPGVPGIMKKPSPPDRPASSKLLLKDEVTPGTRRVSDPRGGPPPLHGALLKNEQDVHLFERLVFMARNNR